MNAKDKLTKARVKLVLDQPFFATIALGVQYIEDNNIPTMCTNGKQIKYNAAFVEAMSLDECVGVLCHEVMHISCLHMTRRQGRDARKWNVACDLVINPIILDAKMRLPEGGLFDPMYKDKSAEEVYRLLPDMPQQQGSGAGIGSPDPGGCGGVEDAPAETQAELDQIEAEVKQLVAQAAMVAKQQGKLPAGLERLIDDLMQPKIVWKDVLQRFLTQILHSDYTWAKPNKRYLHMGLYLPTLESIETGEFILIVDTSGSIGGRELNQFASEMQDIASTFKTGFKIIWVDHAVAGVQDVEPDEDLILTPKGGGGTSFVPGVEYIDSEGLEPSAVVYFTDGYCSDFPKAPHYPFLWAVLDNKNFQAPFGEVLPMNSNGNDF